MGLTEESARREYFSDLWDWFLAGGSTHIAAYLHARNLSEFSASNGQRKTNAHKTVVNGGMTGDAWLEDIILELNNPTFIREDTIITKAIAAGERDDKIKPKLMNALNRMGYSLYRNAEVTSGRWTIDGKRFLVYAKVGTPHGLNAVEHVGKELF